jgi:hypothetical protein
VDCETREIPGGVGCRSKSLREACGCEPERSVGHWAIRQLDPRLEHARLANCSERRLLLKTACTEQARERGAARLHLGYDFVQFTT